MSRTNSVITRNDLINYGMLPELARRISGFVQLDSLSDDNIIAISSLPDSTFQRRIKSVQRCYGLDIDAPGLIRDILNEIDTDDRETIIGEVEVCFHKQINDRVIRHLASK